ncbi:hypothetical protein FEM48_Zijuj07G0046200 [Ziziphus jujuba var. spinosa]|uniref:EF-hand domain-containing protein n=1 Tax=Ziziphus jujuba var. spinosa TaxID=714518 RepID=A0A978V2H5_ZIZJJ|nr:phloretin 4'-O-glucosyltransferase-like [Ziziphus jujuba var. spinosa]KAH7521558.1 hypothetical protein FEM48_Zijuj07G0046200 [Ziziphus jujuba var. spinosa]
MVQPRFLIVVYPAQGHINPGLQFAKRLIHIGAEVTFVTTISAYRRMNKAASIPSGLSFAPYSDGYDDGFKHGVHDADHFLSELSRCGKQAISDLVVSAAKEGRPFCCVVYSILLPWAPEAAHELQVPSALLWIQPTTVFHIYYYYFHGYDNAITNNGAFNDGPSWSIELPGLPLKLKRRDLPSFMDAGNAYTFAIPLFKDQFEKLELGNNRKVLVNTFDALEPEALKAIGINFDLIGIGPLIPSAFLDGKDPSDTSFGGDLLQHPKDYYIEWLSSKPKGSVIYVSFGSMSVLAKPQMEEVGRALLEMGRPFLWVIREKPDSNNGEDKKEEDQLSCREELEKLGKIVPWCSQLDVLSNSSCGCFVTHCGWNSTLESIACGVPMIGYPQWSDQGTNAKLIEDVWKIGLRVNKNKDGIVESDEFKRCLEVVMGDGDKGEEMRRNAKKLKDLARESAKEGGSSDKNLKEFVDEINQKERAGPQV